MNSVKPHLKKLVLLTIIGAVICAFFWLGSRYPALNIKALMGAQISVSGIGFDVLVPITEQQGFIEKVFNTTINWLYSNMTGMSFGLLIAPVILCGFSLLAHLQPKNAVLASLVGAVIGAPLGVCANCATPIALGIGSGKGRLETMLAVIISSPTLNIIAITMMLSVLPSYVVAIKLLITLLLVIVCIPLLTRLEPDTTRLAPLDSLLADKAQIGFENHAITKGWLASLHWVTQQYLRNFIAIIKVALPFMVLAGALGAALVNSIPIDSINNFQLSSYASKMLALAGVSLIASLLPVPMTFDVIVATNLQMLGVEVRYVAAALFGLGTFSIYPYLILRKYTSKTLANRMLFVVIGASFIAGGLSHYLAKPYQQWQQQQYQQKVLASAQPLTAITHQPPKVFSALPPAPKLHFTEVLSTPSISIMAAPFQPKTEATPNTPQFQRYIGDTLGLNNHYQITLELFTDIGLFNGIATGDINDDHWDDVLLVDSSGLRMFLNTGHLQYIELALPSYTQGKHPVTAAALADINDDGKLDIIYSTAYEGIRVLYNTGGKFTAAPTGIPNLTQALINPHLGFSDIDRDGDLDILASNWTTGSFSDSYNLTDASNALILNHNGTFETQRLGCKPGETLSILSTNLNNDRWPDLLVANDFLPPDCFYIGSASGPIEQSRAQTGFAVSPIHSMSYDSGDINNDGLLDYFATDIADPFEDKVIALDASEGCDDLKQTVHYANCKQAQQLRRAVNQKHEYISCVPERSSAYFEHCQAYVYFLHIMETQQPCDTIPAVWPVLLQTCNDARKTKRSATTALPDINFDHHRGNALHIQNGDGSFSNRELPWGVQHTGWSWNARFADLNHDTWQDLYIVNGYPIQAYDETNLLFLNNSGKGFVNATQKAGLTDNHITMNYSYSDIDNDGDLDILSLSPYGPLNIWVNELKHNNAIKISLIDHTANHFGVGALVKIRYGGQNIQIRELKLSGGFGSNDAPYLHFGLAEHRQIESLEVHWLSGETSLIEKPLEANRHYTIERRSH